MEQETILIVDDESAVITALGTYLSEQPWNILTAPGGIRALEILRGQNIDLAVVDLRMPDLDGLSLLKIAKKDKIRTNIIILTGFGSIPIAIEATRYGAVDFIEKPINKSDFIQAILQNLPTPYPRWKDWFDSFILARYSDPDFSFRDVMRHFRFSQAYGYALFKKHVGKPFRVRLLEIRIEKARELLEDTTLRVSEIAAQCGFRYSQRLSETFQQRYGMPPTKYRKFQNPPEKLENSGNFSG